MTEEEKRKKRQTQIRLQLRPKHKNASSPYRCVFLAEKGWLVQIKMPSCRIVMGPFETEEKAAIAFNRKEVWLRGTPAVLNDIPGRCYRLMGRELGGG